VHKKWYLNLIADLFIDLYTYRLGTCCNFSFGVW